MINRKPVRKEGKAMTRRLKLILLAAVFIGGFASLSLELIVLRQLSSFVGATAVTASIVIGVIMAFMSLGYYAGSVFCLTRGAVRQTAVASFYSLSILTVLAASYILIDLYFSMMDWLGLNDNIVKTFVYCLALLSYPSFLFGKITSLLSRYLHKYNRNFTGKLMAVDTVGSVLGSILSTLLLMPLIGVNYTVVLVVAMCALGAVLLDKKFNFYWLGLIIAAAVLLNRSSLLYKLYYIVEDNAVSTISIFETDNGQSRFMSINGSSSSKISADENLLFPYISYIENNFIKTLPHDKPRKVLILGVGGFTLGRDDDFNRYVYVDVDKVLLPLSEKYFLNGRLGKNKKFEVQDANQFLKESREKYDLIILDTYSSARVIPQDLVTREYFLRVKNHLAPGGIVAMNLIASPDFASDFSMNLDNTLRSVFPQNLQRQVIGDFNPWKSGELSNLIYVYYDRPNPRQIYTINKNASYLDN